jgi:hypothetical protein
MPPARAASRFVITSNGQAAPGRRRPRSRPTHPVTARKFIRPEK